MDTDTIVFGGLIVVQIIGSILLVGSLFLSGLGLLTVVGGLLVVLSVAGLAVTATIDEERYPDQPRDAIANRFGRESK